MQRPRMESRSVVCRTDHDRRSHEQPDDEYHWPSSEFRTGAQKVIVKASSGPRHGVSCHVGREAEDKDTSIS